MFKRKENPVDKRQLGIRRQDLSQAQPIIACGETRHTVIFLNLQVEMVYTKHTGCCKD